MTPQRKLLTILLLAAGALAVLLVIALRSSPGGIDANPARDPDAPPAKPKPSEPTESSDERSSLAPAASTELARAEQPIHVPGPPVKIVGRISDEHRGTLEGTRVSVYDSRGERHEPEILRTDWYECTIHERGRTLVVATREGSCTTEIPFEVLEPDVERHIDLVLPARPALRIHVRDLEGKPLPRFPKDQPLKALLRAAASREELPAQLPVQLAVRLAGGTATQHLGWGDFEPESLQRRFAGESGIKPAGSARRKGRPRGGDRVSLTTALAAGFEWDPSDYDDGKFDSGVAKLRSHYKHRAESEGVPPADDPERKFLAALGYIGEGGAPIEGESPLRDLAGVLTLERPLPLRISLFAGQTKLDSAEPLPWTEDLHFKIDTQRLQESYVHAWLFAKDAQTGARLPRVRANLHVDPLPGALANAEETARRPYEGRAGQEAPSFLGAPIGWRFPDGDVETDLDGRADFHAALPGWWRLSLEADGHVPVTKWVFVERGSECYLDYFELAPLATSRLQVTSADGAGVHAKFELRPLLHALPAEGLFESFSFESDDAGQLELVNAGRQQLLLRSVDPRWAIEPVVIDNTQLLVDKSPLHALPAQHVLLHLPAGLPWSSIVNVAQGLTRPVYEEAFGGKTLIDLWLADGTYTLRVSQGITALLTIKFTVAGEPMLVEVAP